MISYTLCLINIVSILLLYDNIWVPIQFIYFQFRQTDFIWLELNSEFDLNLYVINPGDDIFAPFFHFPTPPTKQHLSKNLAWTQIMLTKETKETKRNKNETCNGNNGYVYGGTHGIP